MQPTQNVIFKLGKHFSPNSNEKLEGDGEARLQHESGAWGAVSDPFRQGNVVAEPQHRQIT